MKTLIPAILVIAALLVGAASCKKGPAASCSGDRMVYDTLKKTNTDLTTYSSTFTSGQAGTVIVNSGTKNHLVSIDYQHFPGGLELRYTGRKVGAA
jgi:hypothetical protein